MVKFKLFAQIRKRNDQKNAEEKKHNKELAAIERVRYLK